MPVSRNLLKTEPSDLSVGRALPSVSFILYKTSVESYIDSVEDCTGIYLNKGLVPPLAIAAIAKKKLMEVLHIPDGAIQSQTTFDFLSPVKLEETLRCRGTISEHWTKNRVNYVAVDIRVNSTDRRCVLKGKMGFILASGTDRDV